MSESKKWAIQQIIWLEIPTYKLGLTRPFLIVEVKEGRIYLVIMTTQEKLTKGDAPNQYT